MGDQKCHEELNRYNLELTKTVFTAIVLIILAIAVLVAVILFFEHFRTQQIIKLCSEYAYVLKESCGEFINNKIGGGIL